LIPIVHHPDYDAPLPDGHRFPMRKFAALADILRAEGLAPNGFEVPTPATWEQLIAAHTPAYVDAVLTQTVARDVERRIGLPVSEPVARRACAATGGTLLTARLALAHGLACNTAGGSHHAARAGGAGFCVFNDVAVAALALLEEGAVHRVLVIDLDVHQGDGTADIFRDDPRVFTFSMHCAENFPSRKIAGDLDVAPRKGMGDEGYLAALDGALSQALDAGPFDLAFYNAGVDPHADDALGLLKLSDAGLAARERKVLSVVRAAGVPVAGVIGGGYGPDINVIARRHAILHRTAASI
jgi:acetoin utilization deacetylase AcuC-like enzyme